LFEFIEPSAFFLSLDDGQNPAGQTAFRRKVLYSYDLSTYDMRVTGIFDFDFIQGKYVTKFGTNPYVATARTRVKNPYYVGKLLTSTPATTSTASTGATASGATSSSAVSATEIAETFTRIQNLVRENKIQEALTLCDQLIVKDPTNIEARKIRYRSLYRLTRYEEALAEVEKVRSLQGDAFQYSIACEARRIAQDAGNTTKQAEYGTICEAR